MDFPNKKLFKWWIFFFHSHSGYRSQQIHTTDTRNKTLTYDSNQDSLQDKECSYQKYYWGNVEFCQNQTSRLTHCNCLRDRHEKTITDKMMVIIVKPVLNLPREKPKKNI